jgi:hypothetical protein
MTDTNPSNPADNVPNGQQAAIGAHQLSAADLEESERVRAQLLAMPLEQVTAMVRGQAVEPTPYAGRRFRSTSIKYDSTFGSLAIAYACAITTGGTGEEEFKRLAAHVDARVAQLPQVAQHRRVVAAAAALLKVRIDDENNREELLVQVREISAALDMTSGDARDGRIAQLERLVETLRPKAQQYDIEHAGNGINAALAKMSANA